MVALLNHNLTVQGTIRIRISDNGDMSAPTYDATWGAWASVYGWEEAPWGAFLWEGYPIEDPAGNLPRMRVIRLPATASGRFLRLDVVDPLNPDGFLEAGRLIAGAGWQPKYNFSFGWSVGVQDPSQQTEMDGGALWVDQRPSYRVLRLPFEHKTEADALGTYNDLARWVGNARDVLVVPFPDDEGKTYQTAVYGVPLKGGIAPPRGAGLNRFVTSLAIREIIA